MDECKEMERERPTTAEVVAKIDGFFDDFENYKDDSEASEETQQPGEDGDGEVEAASPEEELHSLTQKYEELSKRAKRVLLQRAQGRSKLNQMVGKPDGIETRLRAALKQWPQVLSDAKRNHMHYEETLQRLQHEREVKRHRVSTVEKEFEQFCFQIAQEGGATKKALVEVQKLLDQGRLASEKLHKARLSSVNLSSQETELKRQMATKDQLGEGLHLMDYEQLKIENQTLEEKIEERNQELLQLKKKISSTVQVLTHVREKLRFIESDYHEQQVLLEADAQCLIYQKKELQKEKVQCAKLKKKVEIEESRNLSVFNEALLKDFEKLQIRERELESTIKRDRDYYQCVLLQQRTQLNN